MLFMMKLINESFEQMDGGRLRPELVGLLEVELGRSVRILKGLLNFAAAETYRGVNVVRQGRQLSVVRVNAVIGHGHRLANLKLEVRDGLL